MCTDAQTSYRLWANQKAAHGQFVSQRRKRNGVKNMDLNEYLRRGKNLHDMGYETDGCTFVGWFVHKYWPDAEQACWSHDFARRDMIKVKDQSENDNLFKDALKHFNVPRPMRFIMYTFTKTAGFMKDKFNMSLNAFLGFIFFLLLVAGMFYGASLQADPRLEKDVCHFPYNNIDADNELESRVVAAENVYKKVVFENNQIVGCIMLGETKTFSKVTKLMSDNADISRVKDQILSNGFDFEAL